VRNLDTPRAPGRFIHGGQVELRRSNCPSAPIGTKAEAEKIVKDIAAQKVIGFDRALAVPKAPPRQAFRKLVLRTLPGVTHAPFPGFIEPMHPTQHAKVPAYEIKLDGWRGQLHLRNGAAKMFSRNGNDLTAQCSTIMAAAAELQGRELVYAGKAGTGFTVQSAQSVRERLAPLHRNTPPLAKPLKRSDTIWVEPDVIADIAFTELTEDGMLRHASFKG
jgi:ATP-dependent DNA ligase